MAKRTMQGGFFGSVGMSDPESSFAERTFGVAWDCAKKALPENKTIPIMQIPKGFCIDRISVVQTKAMDQDVNITFGLGSDTTKGVGGTFALTDDSSALLRSSQAPKTVTAKDTAGTGTVNVGEAIFVDAADILCLIVPDGLTGDKLAEGAFDVFIHGFETFAEGAADNNALDIENYRLPLQTDADSSANRSDDTGGQWSLD